MSCYLTAPFDEMVSLSSTRGSHMPIYVGRTKLYVNKFAIMAMLGKLGCAPKSL